MGGGQQTEQCLRAPQANDPDEVCGGGRVEALEAQLARVVDQCARCRAVAAILCGTMVLLISPVFRRRGVSVFVSMFCFFARKLVKAFTRHLSARKQAEVSWQPRMNSLFKPNHLPSSSLTPPPPAGCQARAGRRRVGRRRGAVRHDHPVARQRHQPPDR